MKANQNTLVKGLHGNPNLTNGQATRFPRCRSKAEIRAERISWALWACGVYHLRLNKPAANTAQQ